MDLADVAQDREVDPVQAQRVDVEDREAVVGDVGRDGAVGPDLREVADAVQQPVRDPRGAAGAARDLARAGRFDRRRPSR